MKESEIHSAFVAWLKAQNLPFIHSRTDRKHSNTVGDPDFYVLNAGRVMALELKVLGGKLSEAQQKRIKQLRDAGITCNVCFSLQECVDSVLAWSGVTR